ncbi:MAG: hypothetical protein M1503_08525 [Thaumarchaeota archaeon]|nr:hypothetical protein [Nitrososphaerota archaeon]
MNQKYTKRKGISPVLATIILLAVTVAVGVGVASYVFGLFGTYSESAAVKVQGTPNLEASHTGATGNGPVFNVTLTNSGAQSDTVSAVTTTVNGAQITGTIQGSTIKGGGGTAKINATFASLTSSSLTPGTSYQLKISFNSGSLLSVTATAR